MSNATDTQITQITVGSEPTGMAASPDGSMIYVANRESSTVSVIDTATDTVVDTFAVGPQTEANDHYLTVGPDGTVYVVDETGRVLRVVAAS